MLRWQAARLPASLPAPIRVLLRLFRIDVVAKVEKNQARIRATRTDVARIGCVRINARWSREFMAYDPRDDLCRITVPVLAMTGEKDLQVPPEDLAVVTALLGGQAETVLLKDVSHILRTQPGAASIRSYRRDVKRPVDPAVLDRTARWIRQRASSPAFPVNGSELA